MEPEHQGLFLPNLLTFTNGNCFLGSFRGLRFRVGPQEEGEGEPRFQVLCWYGEYCLEESEIQAEAEFPLTAQGRESVIAWLLEQQAQMPQDPPPVSEEEELQPLCDEFGV